MASDYYSGITSPWHCFGNLEVLLCSRQLEPRLPVDAPGVDAIVTSIQTVATERGSNVVEVLDVCARP
jgi:hypothetical protein